MIPAEGWHVLHLFYNIEHSAWQLFSPEEQREWKTELSALVQEIRSTKDTQLLIFSMVSPKADIGFMLLTPDLHVANAFEKRLTLSLGSDVLTPVFSYLSMTERSEYTTTDEEYSATLQTENGLVPGSPEHEQKMDEFRARMTKYLNDRLYPKLPPWPVLASACAPGPLKKRAKPKAHSAAIPLQRTALPPGRSRGCSAKITRPMLCSRR